MEVIVNAYAIVEADNEEEAKKKGTNLKFDCNLSPVDNYGKIAALVPFYHGDADMNLAYVRKILQIVANTMRRSRKWQYMKLRTQIK